ncbi:MAG: hypothetical protein NPIRA02_35200 [Nitrospirales bacterium]|nr:MAG: hypothetical protein NPIRA02_35200 [Nitrospirales bacterium]
MDKSPLDTALRHFGATEANLLKLEKLWKEIRESIPDGISFYSGESPDFDDKCRNFDELLEAIPKIDGWKPEIHLMDLDAIAQNRLDAQDVGEVNCLVSVEQEINEPGRILREYRFRFNKKRRELIKDSLIELINIIDSDLREISKVLQMEAESNKAFAGPRFGDLKKTFRSN